VTGEKPAEREGAHGGVGAESPHRPVLASRGSLPKRQEAYRLAYFLSHQHQPFYSSA